MLNFEIVHCMWIRFTRKTTIKNAPFALPQSGVENYVFTYICKIDIFTIKNI